MNEIKHESLSQLYQKKSIQIGIKYKNLSELYQGFDSIFESKGWGMIKVETLERFIYLNLRLIVEQTQTLTGQELHEKLHKLSKIINRRFTDPKAHNLAFEIMGIAQGIFSKEEDKRDYTSLLLDDVRKKIYSELIATNSSLLRYGERLRLGTFRLVSKFEAKIAHEINLTRIIDVNASFRPLSFQTIPQAILYIKNNKNLYCANLSIIQGLTDKDLQDLQDCTWLQHLSISSNKITDDGIKFLVKMPLKSVDFSFCNLLTDKALKNLSEMPLESVNFRCCRLLTDNALEYLKGMSLKSVDFSACLKLTDKALENLREMPLESANFTFCRLLTDNSLEYLKNMPLKSVDFRACRLLTDGALKNFKENFSSRGLKLDILH